MTNISRKIGKEVFNDQCTIIIKEDEDYICLSIRDRLNEDDFIGLTFDQLEKISKIFKTKHINIGRNGFLNDQCDTCGFGTYEIEIYIKKEK